MVLFDLPLTKALTIALFIPAYVWFVNYQGCMPLKCSVRPAAWPTHAVHTCRPLTTTRPFNSTQHMHPAERLPLMAVVCLLPRAVVLDRSRSGRTTPGRPAWSTGSGSETR